MLIRRYPVAWGGTDDEWLHTVRHDVRVDEVRDALLDVHRIRLLTNQAQRGSVTAFSRSFLFSEKARLESRYHMLVEALIHHYVQQRPPEALSAVEEALTTLQQETASFAAAVEIASLEVRARHMRHLKHATCGRLPEGVAGEASEAWADACAEVIVQACLATIRRGPADCAVRFYCSMNGLWVAQRRVLIIPPQVQGKEGPIFLPPVMLDERLPLTVFADLLVRPTALSFPLGLLAPFPGWEATAQWQRIRGRVATDTTDMDGTEVPPQRPTGQNAATQAGQPGQSGQSGQPSAAIPAMISAGTHQYLYPCRSEALGLMWPAFACELSDPDELARSVSGVSA